MRQVTLGDSQRMKVAWRNRYSLHDEPALLKVPSTAVVDVPVSVGAREVSSEPAENLGKTAEA